MPYKVYCDKERGVREDLASENIVMESAESNLNCSLTLFMDNFYSSVQLAEKLLNNAIHLVGETENLIHLK